MLGILSEIWRPAEIIWHPLRKFAQCAMPNAQLCTQMVSSQPFWGFKQNGDEQVWFECVFVLLDDVCCSLACVLVLPVFYYANWPIVFQKNNFAKQ